MANMIAVYYGQFIISLLFSTTLRFGLVKMKFVFPYSLLLRHIFQISKWINPTFLVDEISRSFMLMLWPKKINFPLVYLLQCNQCIIYLSIHISTTKFNTTFIQSISSNLTLQRFIHSYLTINLNSLYVMKLNLFFRLAAYYWFYKKFFWKKTVQSMLIIITVFRFTNGSILRIFFFFLMFDFCSKIIVIISTNN